MSAGVHTFTASGNARQPDLYLFASWIRDSWDAIYTNIITKGFKKCCLTNAMDGTEDYVLWQDEPSSAISSAIEDEEDVVNDNKPASAGKNVSFSLQRERNMFVQLKR